MKNDLRRLKLGTIGADEPFFLKTHGINDETEAVRLVEERTLGFTVGAAKEDAEIGVAMIPADDGISARGLQARAHSD